MKTRIYRNSDCSSNPRLSRSADWQSAVSPIGNRQSVRKVVTRGNCGDHAECHSAIQQIANLRYGIGDANVRYGGADANVGYDAAIVARRDQRGAFSLVEILVTVGLLAFIVLGLLAMFNQTQRAFRSSITQNDVLESGRAVMEMITRELQQMRPSQCPDFYNGAVRYRATNFLVEPCPYLTNVLTQELVGSAFQRTNLVQQFFFLSKVNQDWIGTGYTVVADSPGASVGSLYRFYMTNYSRTGPMTASYFFENPLAGTTSRILDGVVHLRVKAYANSGDVVTYNTFTATNGFGMARYHPPKSYAVVANTFVYTSGYDTEQMAAYFLSNAVPAYLEVELGILEPRIVQHYRAIGNSTPALQQQQRDYLFNHSGQVHLFRQRVPIINVDTLAYSHP